MEEDPLSEEIKDEMEAWTQEESLDLTQNDSASMRRTSKSHLDDDIRLSELWRRVATLEKVCLDGKKQQLLLQTQVKGLKDHVVSLKTALNNVQDTVKNLTPRTRNGEGEMAECNFEDANPLAEAKQEDENYEMEEETVDAADDGDDLEQAMSCRDQVQSRNSSSSSNFSTHANEESYPESPNIILDEEDETEGGDNDDLEDAMAVYQTSDSDHQAGTFSPNLSSASSNDSKFVHESDLKLTSSASFKRQAYLKRRHLVAKHYEDQISRRRWKRKMGNLLHSSAENKFSVYRCHHAAAWKLWREVTLGRRPDVKVVRQSVLDCQNVLQSIKGETFVILDAPGLSRDKRFVWPVRKAGLDYYSHPRMQNVLLKLNPADDTRVDEILTSGIHLQRTLEPLTSTIWVERTDKGKIAKEGKILFGPDDSKEVLEKTVHLVYRYGTLDKKLGADFYQWSIVTDHRGPKYLKEQTILYFSDKLGSIPIDKIYPHLLRHADGCNCQGGDAAQRPDEISYKRPKGSSVLIQQDPKWEEKNLIYF